MDEDIAFLDKSVLLTTSQNYVDTTYDRSENNQKRVRVRYSVLNNFDPIIKKENDVNPLDCINETEDAKEVIIESNEIVQDLDTHLGQNSAFICDTIETKSRVSESALEQKSDLSSLNTCCDIMGDTTDTDDNCERKHDLINSASESKLLPTHNRQSLDSKMSIDELAERVKAAVAKHEKSKTKVNYLTKELKICQEKNISLEKEVEELKALLEEHQNNKSRITEEQEKSISKIVAEKEKLKKERDTAQMHLANIELAFSDVHHKYERCKAVIQGYRNTEKSFRQDITMNRETITIQEQKYETLMAHAMAQLEKSNQELAALKKKLETEISKLTAQLKRCEIRNISLVESLQQKTKECEQLSKLCDEFIRNV